jgi:uncharacterized OB-fold protein
MNSETRSPLATYLDYLKRGQLAYQYSLAANKAVFFPRVACPVRGDTNLEWRISAGLGTVYSTTTVHPSGSSPFNVALVDCDEGFRLMTRIEGIAPEQVTIGMRVKFSVFHPGDDDPYPIFFPAEAE